MVFSKRVVRLSLLTAGILGTIYFLWAVRSGLYPFIIGFFLAYLLNPAVCLLENKGLKRLWAIVIIYIVLFTAVLAGGSKLIPLLLRELENFGRELPNIIARSEALLEIIQFKYQNSALPYSLKVAIDDSLLAVQRDVQNFTGAVVSGIIGIISHFIGLAISPILAFYLLHDWYEIKEELLLILPNRWRHEIIMVFKDIDKVLSGVIRGQITVALIVGILISSGLYLLHVRFALLIGILAGMLDIIPYFGAVIGATPAVTLALLETPWLALKVVLLFFVVHQLEGTVIGPKILGENVGLHPLSVMFFLFVGEEVGGLTGMLLGVPLAAMGKVLLRHLIQALL